MAKWASASASALASLSSLLLMIAGMRSRAMDRVGCLGWG